MSAPPLAACHCCGLVQRLPAAAPLPAGRVVPTARRLRCQRCHTTLRGGRRTGPATAAFALAALILFPLAVTMPVLRVERLGHSHESSIWTGVVELLADGQWLVGGVVLVCSLVLPVVKLACLFTLAGGARALAPRMRARTWHLVELTGRWGMLDVLLVALLVAILKLGDIVTIHPGAGAWAFGVCVLLNLVASALFDPHELWNTAQQKGTNGD